MRIGSVFEWKTNAFYRAVGPLEALRRRGHDVEFANTDEDADVGVFRPRNLRGCEVIHGYRVLSSEQVRVVRRLVLSGAAFVWDTDDDLEHLPVESPDYRRNGGRHARRIFADTVETARMADVVTTTTEALAERYRAVGIERVEVIGNYLPREMLGSRRVSHDDDGIVVGWLAGLEHGSELPRIPIVHALQRLADAEPAVRIESIGLSLGLRRDRYKHVSKVEWADMQHYMAAWGIGIAPLADIPFNRARSDVKLKEYASVGIPWLASPIGPYVDLGERQGGRLVSDDGWFDALQVLVRSRRHRDRLGRRARRWAKNQSIDRHAHRWEAVLREGIERRARRAALV
jgi:glycosyltransferase involved in cell wall biosynthesis